MQWIVLLVLAGFGYANESEINLKSDAAIIEVSSKYSTESYPKGVVDAWWASLEYNKKKSEFHRVFPFQYRHMHAFVVAAFYAKRADHREMGMEWLERYECENFVACREYFRFLEGAYKANILTIKDKEKRAAAEKVLSAARERFEKVRGQKPAVDGLCAAKSQPAKWLEQEYAIFCPLSKKWYGRSSDNCPACIDPKHFSDQVGRDSRQVLLSSSYVEKLEHVGAIDCNTPWKVELVCGGGVQSSQTFLCERFAGTHPLRVECGLTR